MEGYIKKLVPDRSFGFIRSKEGREYFFHISGLKNARFEDLVEGQEVTFEDNETSKGLRAEDVYV